MFCLHLLHSEVGFVPSEVGFEPQLCVYHFHKSGIQVFVGESSCVKNSEFQDAIGFRVAPQRVPREERPARSQGQDPHRRGEEGGEEAQDCSMAPGEPEGKVSIAALPTLERFVCSGSGANWAGRNCGPHVEQATGQKL